MACNFVGCGQNKWEGAHMQDRRKKKVPETSVNSITWHELCNYNKKAAS